MHRLDRVSRFLDAAIAATLVAVVVTLVATGHRDGALAVMAGFVAGYALTRQ